MIDAPRAIDAPPASACLSASTDMSGGHHYFKTANMSWAAAQGACVAVGGHLAKIETSTEDDFITATFTLGGYVWIGLQDPTDTDVYVWADLTPLGTSYNGFPSMTPPISAGNCVDTNGTWDPYTCGATNHGGVCECE